LEAKHFVFSFSVIIIMCEFVMEKYLLVSSMLLTFLNAYTQTK
jgi:hypothetical protein